MFALSGTTLMLESCHCCLPDNNFPSYFRKYMQFLSNLSHFSIFDNYYIAIFALPFLNDWVPESVIFFLKEFMVLTTDMIYQINTCSS